MAYPKTDMLRKLVGIYRTSYRVAKPSSSRIFTKSDLERCDGRLRRTTVVLSAFFCTSKGLMAKFPGGGATFTDACVALWHPHIMFGCGIGTKTKPIGRMTCCIGCWCRSGARGGGQVSGSNNSVSESISAQFSVQFSDKSIELPAELQVSADALQASSNFALSSG